MWDQSPIAIRGLPGYTDMAGRWRGSFGSCREERGAPGRMRALRAFLCMGWSGSSPLEHTSKSRVNHGTLVLLRLSS